MPYIFTTARTSPCRSSGSRSMAGRRKQDKSRSNSPVHIFIEQDPASFPRGGSKIVSSHARRFQSAGKRRRQEALAFRGAEYARSLVGWNPSASTPTPSTETLTPIAAAEREKLTSRTRSPSRHLSVPASATRKRRTSSLEPKLEDEETGSSPLTLPVRGGLRVDPFDVFPTSNSRTVMLMVDFRKLD